MLEGLNVFYWPWEMDLLYAIQGMHNPVLDVIMKVVSDMGNAGICWMAVATLLLFFKKYRKTGIQSWITIVVVFIVGNLILKNAFMRARPCQIDTTVALLVKIPSDASFPSGHTMNGFATSLSILFNDKKLGIPAVIFATIIAFSRLYNFVHFPTDVIGGFVIALIFAILVNFVMKKISQKKEMA